MGIGSDGMTWASAMATTRIKMINDPIGCQGEGTAATRSGATRAVSQPAAAKMSHKKEIIHTEMDWMVKLKKRMK
jgi:hypothetical protein